ncbi:MAG: L,D-transpeptidase [Chloroflexi bacterium]|nr:L,D-transpeptidase [Chloroflexota bacterium]
MALGTRTLFVGLALVSLGLTLQPALARAQASREPIWVQNHMMTELWSGPDDGALFFGWLRRWSYLRVERWEGQRLYVFNPRANNFAYVNASALGPSGPPPADYLAPLKTVATLNTPARIVGTATIYAAPVEDEAEWLREERHNTPVFVEDQVHGDGDGTWYRLESGEYVEASSLRFPERARSDVTGNWIDVSLTEPSIATAYEGDKPVYAALAVHGTGRWLTPTGTFAIQRRVANETMSSEGLGIPRDAPGGYYLQNVLYTQYFLGSGESIHYNYWSANFGYAGSHGCLGMNYDDALFFWQWAAVGTPVVIHY